MTVNEKIEKISDLVDQAIAFSVEKDMKSFIACLDEAVSIFSEIPFQDTIGKHPVYIIYNSLAIATGVFGEELRKQGKTDEALEYDFRAISLMEKAIEYSSNAPKSKKIQYKTDTIVACIYVAVDLFRKRQLNESIKYCEKIVKYAYDVPLGELKKSICQIADIYEKNNISWLKQNFGEYGLAISLQTGKELRRCTKTFFSLFKKKEV
jgi:tetratricopeptide (TPR) repeat protein